MAWTTPRTWTLNENVTPAMMNTDIRDNMNALPHLIVRKTADESDSSGTVQPDNVLLLPLAANEVWQFRFNLLVVSPSTADFMVALAFPSGSVSALVYGANATSFQGSDFSSTTSPTSTIVIQTASTVSNHVIVEGVMSNGVTAGNLNLQWSNNAAGTATVKANSTLWGVKLA